jgi:uncharacterized cupredoxin-like copper-binding protein
MTTRVFLCVLCVLCCECALVLAHEGAQAKIDYAQAKETPFGKPIDPKRAARTIAIEMGDTMRFTPAEVRVARGERVRFVVTNKGALMHEMVLGRMQDLREHAEHMRAHPQMKHDEPNLIHVAPGKSGEMGWQFSGAGELYYGCLVPGHFEAGMVGRIVVSPR